MFSRQQHTNQGKDDGKAQDKEDTTEKELPLFFHGKMVRAVLFKTGGGYTKVTPQKFKYPFSRPAAMAQKEARWYWYLLLILIASLAFLTLKLSSSPTGYFAYSSLANPEFSAEKVWNFQNAAEYLYDTSKINLSGGEAKLIPTITTTTTTRTETSEITISSATVYETNKAPRDETSKVTSQGQGQVELKDDKKVLEITLAKVMKNGDVLSLYILGGSTSQGKVYICTNSSGCSSAEYGELTLPQMNDDDDDTGLWFNITLSSISSTKATFGLDSPNKIKIDMVNGYNKTTREETTSTTTYPVSAALETTDLQPANLKKWGTLATAEQLNGQQIQYQYSVNSGSSWQALPSDGNLSSVTTAKIRVKATLQSNGTATPLIQQMKLPYITQVPCTEQWNVSYGACLSNNTQLQFYVDTNNCETTTNLPTNNNTYISCDYCTPQWNPANTSCSPAGRFTSWFSDENNCYDATGLESDLATRPANLSTTCNYCALHNCTNSFQAVLNSSFALNSTTWFIDAKEKAKAWLEFTAPNAQGAVTILEYNQSKVNSTPPAIDLRKQVEINTTVKNVTSVKITLYYTDEELQRDGVDENTLKIYYHNESSGQWQTLPSTVNTTGNYVYAIVDHLSLYGLYGEQAPSAATESSSASSSDGGGSSGRTRLVSEAVPETIPPIETSITETVQPVLETPAPTAAPGPSAEFEQPCTYVVEVTLPDSISFIGSNSFAGELENTGDCDIASLQLEVSPELQEIVDLQPALFETIRQGEKDRFILVRRQQQREKLYSFVTAFATADELGSRTINGQVVLKSAGQGQAYERELPLRVIVPAPLRLTSPPVVKIGLALLVFTLLLLVLHLDRKRKVRKLRRGSLPYYGRWFKYFR